MTNHTWMVTSNHSGMELASLTFIRPPVRFTIIHFLLDMSLQISLSSQHTQQTGLLCVNVNYQTSTSSKYL